VIRSGVFEAQFRRLVLDIAHLLKRMRNQATPVFLYPRDPSPDIQEAHGLLKRELVDSGYRLLPDSLLSLEQKMHDSALVVFLMGAEYDARLRTLLDAASTRERPWVVWGSPAAESTRNPDQRLMRPRGAPYAELAKTLGAPESELRKSSFGLLDAVGSGPEPVVLVVDQFEELFRYLDEHALNETERERAAADAAEFVQLLLTASDEARSVSIVITLRSDYLGECCRIPGTARAAE